MKNSIRASVSRQKTTKYVKTTKNIKEGDK